MHRPQSDGTVVVTRDSPWNDEERELQDAYDELVCAWCGNLREECEKPTTAYYPQRYYCAAMAQQQVVERRMQLGHDRPEWKPHPLDGVRVFVTPEDLQMGGDFIPKRPKESG